MGASSRSEEDDGGGGPSGAAASGHSSASRSHHHLNRSSSHLHVPGNGGDGGGGGGQRAHSPVAETLFRKDLISAMKLPDNEPLTSDDYWTVTDTWKQEWEKGVQVPVKPEQLPEPRVSRLTSPPHSANRFQL